MTATAAKTAPRLASRLVNGVLSIKPLAKLAKNRARNMMIKRAETIGVYWPKEVKALKARGSTAEFSPEWEAELAQVQNPNLAYPDYYLTSFHAYEEGNMGWEPATEVEVAAHAVHARIWPEAGAQGDAMLRQSYHNAVKSQILAEPKDILDLGCSVGMSTFALQETYPQARVTGLELSPYFLTVARYKAQKRQLQINWVHAKAEETGLPTASFDLVSACLVFHELPQSAAIAIFQEVRRILRPGGHFTIMDMNPKSEIYAKMPPYILTLLKSTEPYLDQYFALDIEKAMVEAGFHPPTITANSPRHRTIVAQAK
ncbi:class I SAM-dependent methyltransferase [Trichocoleus sp. FACHB-591]|uniref:class I SAM-dependent methyltransferase n=1 Tax=unclassified Trichocoleus TaxID=2628910 RepID=UPI001682965D|nr:MULTISPECIES: class I SAM-dependent methyltransferase [unclassified Trichocoleus]MBD2096962.1 class I SAM-dependent methyltransferase [Trichocoleus sp. FACHB-591]MBD2122168.1 class I SAM-dependent methyltransferase [Trichocoleus sp. FACHB-262]